MQMVEQAVQRLKGQVVEEEPDPTLRLNVSAFIPEDYVADPPSTPLVVQAAVVLRRRSVIWPCCTGRFRTAIGPPPDPVERLFEVMQIRMQAKALRLTSIELKTGSVVITLDAESHGRLRRRSSVSWTGTRSGSGFSRRSPLNSKCRMRTGLPSFRNSPQPCKASAVCDTNSTTTSPSLD